MSSHSIAAISARGRTGRRLAVAAGLTVMFVLAACGGNDGGQVQVEGQQVKLVKAGRLTTCTHLPYPPFQSEQSGKVVGFDVDMIDLVAKKLGVTQQIVDTPFETIKTGSALNAGKCDVAAAGMTIRPDRARFIDFSKPYFDATQALMATKDSGITSLDDVKSKRLKLGSQAGTTGEDFVKDDGLNPKSYENSQALLDALRSGQVDVIVQDYPVVRNWLKDSANSDYAVAANLNTGEQYGFAVRKGGNPKLLEEINQTLDQARRDGTYKQIYQKWIGPLPEGTEGG